MNSQNDFHVCHIILRMDIGGLERVLINLINASPNNYKHSIVCIESAKEFSELINKDVKVVELKKPPGREFKTHQSIFRFLREHKPDAVNTYNLPTIEYLAVAWLARVKVRVHAEHGREMDDIDGNNKKRNLLRKLSFPFATRVVTVSDDLKAWLLKTFNLKAEHVVKIENGINTQVFSNKRLEKPTIKIGLIGRLDDVKNQQEVINLCTFLEEKEPDLLARFKFEIVGDGPNYDALNSAIEQAGFEDKICLLGKRMDIPELLNQFSIFLQTSNYEALPMTIIEAMSCELPVISSNVGGVSQLIAHNKDGFLYELGNLEQLTGLLKRVVHNQENEIQNICDNARKKVVEQYSSESMFNKYQNIYQTVK